MKETKADIIDYFRAEIQLEIIGDILEEIMVSSICEKESDFKDIIDKTYEIIAQSHDMAFKLVEEN